MKTYWSIPGPKEIAEGPCIAFYKYDGSNMRFDWSKKQGWYRFGTRYQVVDPKHPKWGLGHRIFLDSFAEDFERTFRDSTLFPRIERATVYCEFFGPSSFAGFHDWNEPKELMAIDINIHKRGFILPEDFLKHFGHLRIAEVVYNGEFNRQFVDDVRDGKYPVEEGVVAKGVRLGKSKKPQHGLWMVKVKTRWWLEELKRRAAESEQYQKALQENLDEQGIM